MNASDFVQLHHGPTVPLEPLRLLWELEDRGVRLRLDGDDIVANPREQLTDEDRRRLRRWKGHCLAILAYCASGLADVH